MFTLSIKPKYVELENLMDHLMTDPVVVVKNPKVVQSLGIHARDLRKKKLLHISPDLRLKETSIILKCSNYYTPGNVAKKTGPNSTIDYVFNTPGIPKITLPDIL